MSCIQIGTTAKQDALMKKIEKSMTGTAYHWSFQSNDRFSYIEIHADQIVEFIKLKSLLVDCLAHYIIVHYEKKSLEDIIEKKYKHYTSPERKEIFHLAAQKTIKRENMGILEIGRAHV